MNYCNEIVPIIITIDDVNDADLILHNELSNYTNCFSYYVCNNDGVFTVRFNISITDKYNELSIQKCITEIINIIDNADKNGVIGYGQSSLEANIEIFKPLYAKLVEETHRKWPIYDVDDLYQICMYVICKLYKRNYYLHKHLIIKSFKHEIWCEQRRRMNKQGDYTTVSIENIVIGKDSDDASPYDIIPDEKYENTIDKAENEDYIHSLLVELKKALKKSVTPRQWEQLLIEYGGKHTTNWSRMMVRRIKEKLRKKNITKEDL